MVKNAMNRMTWIVFAFAAIWGSSLPGIILPRITLYPIRIIVLCWIFFALIFTRKFVFTPHVQGMSLLILFAYGIISLIWSCNIDASLTTILVYATSIMILIICSKECTSSNNIQYACEAIYINMLIMSIIAIYESFTGNYLNLTYEYYTRTFNMLGYYRPIAAFYNTNNLTVFFIMCLPIAILATEKWKHTSLWKIIIFSLSAFIIILTDSRTGYIGLLLFIALYLYYRYYISTGSKKVLIGFCAIVAIIIALVLLPNYWINFFGQTSVYDEDRLSIWQAALKNCVRYWFMGAGPGTSEYLGGSLGLTHNYLLEILCEFGIVGLISFLCLIFSIIPKHRELKYENNAIYIRSELWIFLICTICPSTMTGYYYVWFIFGICAAYTKNKYL